jgi:hypothetical protein
MPVRDHARRLQQLDQRFPDDRIGTYRLGRTLRHVADCQRRVP